MNRIALSYVRSSRGLVVISTFRLTERWATSMPKFQSVVYPARRVRGSGIRKLVSKREIDGERYEFFTEARKGHALLVAKWRK